MARMEGERQAGGQRNNIEERWWVMLKNPPANANKCKRRGFDPWVGKIPWRGKWQPSAVFLPGKFHAQRNLVGYRPWVTKSQM